MADEELRLEADPDATRRGFEEWLLALRTEADELDWGWLLPERRLAFRHLQASPPRLRTEFSAGAEAGSAIVQINEPRVAGSENPLAGIAVDRRGGRHVVRQGELHENRINPDRIKGADFRRLTGLRPVGMTVAGAPAKRSWYVVTGLDDVTADEIVARTSAFIDRCWDARVAARDGDADKEPVTDPDQRSGSREAGGETTVHVDAHDRTMVRRQGYVWAALHDVLAASGITMSKPRHVEGYEVDAVVERGHRGLLIEIKSSSLPPDVYAAVGQLTLYPRLLPGLAGHGRVLLLPDAPSDALLSALEGMGMAVHRYSMQRLEQGYDVTFEASFLRRCGCA